MARLFWVALGAAAGVYAVRKVSKAAEAYTPTGVAHGLADFGDGLPHVPVREGRFDLDASVFEPDLELGALAARRAVVDELGKGFADGGEDLQRLLDSADIRLDGDRAWDIQVHDNAFLHRVLSHGSLGLGESPPESQQITDSVLGG